MLPGPSIRMLTLDDAHGAPLAEFTYYPAQEMMHACWHGPLTAAEVIRGVRHGGQWQNELGYSRILDNKTDAGGDWSEVLPWLEYEWLPLAMSGGLCAIAYVFSKEVDDQFLTQQFVAAMARHLAIKTFESEDCAYEWLLAQPALVRLG